MSAAVAESRPDVVLHIAADEETLVPSVSVFGRSSVFRAAAILSSGLLWSVIGSAEDLEKPASLKPLGGHWYVNEAVPPVYYYEDSGRYLDLFSWHRRDSNNDGIDNVVITHDAESLILDSQGYPNHPTAIFPNSGNPNRIQVQKFRFRLPLVPQKSDHITRVPMGPIGVALNGVVFFNPFEAGGMNAVEGYSEVWLDSCCGHPEQRGVYHYHKYPVCVKSPFKDNGRQHSPVIGFAFDGFPIYGPWEADGLMARDASGEQSLDVCNGHTDAQRGYHYHVTPDRFPYVIGGYAGIPAAANLRGPGRLGTGPIEDNSSGSSRLPNVISAIRPASAVPGKRHTLSIVLNPAESGRRALPEVTPDWVQIGPFESVSIQRDGNTLTVDVEIPEDAPVGVLLDCHLEFKAEGRTRTVFRSRDVFRVVEDEESISVKP